MSDNLEQFKQALNDPARRSRLILAGSAVVIGLVVLAMLFYKISSYKEAQWADYEASLNHSQELTEPGQQREMPSAGARGKTARVPTQQLYDYQHEGAALPPSAAHARQTGVEHRSETLRSKRTAVTQGKPQVVLYCDAYATSSQAEAQKAKLALLGVSSAVVSRGEMYALQLGPFKERTQARELFKKLDEELLVDGKSLVYECLLEDF